MNIRDERIDGGKPFDWGKTSSDYAKYRDIYPQQFYTKIIERNLCVKGQRVLDIGTGTGVLPRNLYKYGASFVGTDISGQQIDNARSLSRQAGQNIEYRAVSAENLDYPKESFDVVTACQCFVYFDYEVLMPKLASLLKQDGRMLVLYMAWLPKESEIAGGSEELVLKYNPGWTGAGEERRLINIPECALDNFTLEYQEVYDLKVHFTRESWHGRIKSCRGIGASLPPEQIELWEKEHIQFLKENAPEEFDILHYAAIAELKKN